MWSIQGPGRFPHGEVDHSDELSELSQRQRALAGAPDCLRYRRSDRSRGGGDQVGCRRPKLANQPADAGGWNVVRRRHRGHREVGGDWGQNEPIAVLSVIASLGTAISFKLPRRTLCSNTTVCLAKWVTRPLRSFVRCPTDISTASTLSTSPVFRAVRFTPRSTP